MTALKRLDAMLGVLDARHRRRSLLPRRGLDFASNDYLGLTGSPELAQAARQALDRGVPLGSGGSRLLRGNHAEHEALEAEAAIFFGSETALYMGGGFQANQAIFSTLPAAGDLVLHDALIHASAHEGLRLGRAQTLAFAHNDPANAERIIQDWRATNADGQIWIAFESIYSMEGDAAPIRDLSDLAVKYDAILVVDEAHATGVFGPQGRGMAHDLAAEVLTLHTCGKGLGVSGGLICGSKVLIETLVNRARPFIFATAPAPFSASMVRASLRLLQENDARLVATRDRISHAHRQARRIGIPAAALNSQIIPVVLADDAKTMRAASELQDAGFDVRGIRPPTVPRGTSRLRISITGNVSNDDISQLFQTLAEII
ncbi:8-amino-7-oxononanoate synthase [Paracoccus xiamenensis]|uniref:8-amino-7-oxononanoate synthase n=1 Tax=Paracoccus xiamenensis TaxID=2714901 RepID=UPI00140DEE82|nr:8-amino-7-oxononanoate synthase [Paracoccus xiamenensis]NHF72041.1 8-amino-7-oxononanoate synthase [Paracoccus xiamenensis]